MTLLCKVSDETSLPCHGSNVIPSDCQQVQVKLAIIKTRMTWSKFSLASYWEKHLSKSYVWLTFWILFLKCIILQHEVQKWAKLMYIPFYYHVFPLYHVIQQCTIQYKKQYSPDHTNKLLSFCFPRNGY